MKKRIAFHTLGCKLNFSESSSIARQFREHDYELVEFSEKADIYIINTCSVTSIAEKKGRHVIRQARLRNPAASIAVVGCFSQLKPEEVAAMDGVDIVLGSSSKFRLFDLIEARRINNISGLEIYTDSQSEKKRSFTPSYSSNDRTRSFLKIQDGCDYFCSYCTIPLARGRSRSATIAEIMGTLGEVMETGVREIVLTGVNIGEFGSDNGESFFDLLKTLEEVKNIPRIRISSIEPNLLSDDMIRFISLSKRILPHFHIPLQSGSNRILELMKRKYTRDVFESRVRTINALLPKACIAADVIVGFPGENEEDFDQTYTLIKSLPLSYCHVFSFSMRAGTLASKLPDQVRDSVKTERSRALQELSGRMKHSFYAQCKGMQAEVLFESDNHNGWMHGFTENYIKVKTQYNPGLVNEIRSVNLRELDENDCYTVNVR